MKASFRLTIALLLVAAAVPLIAWHRGSAAQDSAPQKEQKEKFHRAAKPVRDRYIVLLKQETPSEEVEATVNELLAQHGGNVDHIYTHAIKGFSIQMPEAAAIALSRNPKVEGVEEDREATLSKTEPTSNWNLGRIDQRPTQNDFQYYFPNVENGASVNAYILDSGINLSHREWAKEDGTGNRATLDVDEVWWDGQNGNDCNGHGTEVAGLVGGRTFGVAKGVRLHGVRIFGCGNTTLSSTIIAGVDWVTQNHVKPAVANMSLTSEVDSFMEAAIRGSIAAGVSYVVAAGNNGIDVKDVSPARMPEVLTVGATDINDQREGGSFGSNFGPGVDLFAPGHAVVSAGIFDLNGNGVLDDPAPELLSGTSFSAPHVTGAVARFLQVNPFASPAAVHGAVVNSATPNVVGNAAGSPNLLLYADMRHAKLSQQTAFIPESTFGVDSGVDVGPGQWLGFTGSGEIWSGVWATPNNGPEGWSMIDNNPNLPLPGSRPFSLLGRLNNQNFYIGRSNSTSQSFSAPQRLTLRTNDDVPGNGSGAFNCQVELWKRLPDAAADFINQLDVPTTMLPGQTLLVGVAMRNTSTSTWGANQGFNLAAEGDSMIWGKNRVPLTIDIAPGGNVAFFFYITAPSTPGTYSFQWRMLQEGVQRFGDVSPNTAITVLAPSNQAQFISQSVKSVMTASEFSTVSITMKNTGTTTWKSGTEYRLGSQNPQDNMIWSLNRVALPNDVPPGATVTFTFDVFAPVKSGTYNFQWRMVQDGVEWFGPLTPNVAVSVKPPPCARC